MIRDLWRDIRAAIKQDIESGVLEPGARLLTEPELAKRYGAGRHSVRRAVTELGKEGLLSVEQGRGTFVQTRPRLTYAIGARTRMRRNMNAQGVDVTSETLGTEQDVASSRIATALALSKGAMVVATRRRSFADGVPVSFGTLYHDASRFADFPTRREVMGSVSAVYASYGIEDYVRTSTQIHARPARAEEAQMLHQHPDMPVIVVQAIDADLDGNPIAYTEVIWSSARVTFDLSDRGGDT
jgi:GntR family phosphonate transport system transcriptional regulator